VCAASADGTGQAGRLAGPSPTAGPPGSRAAAAPPARRGPGL